MKPTARRLYRLAVLALGLLALTCGRRDSRPNVVIIAVDALRPDDLGCYGCERPTSPNIDSLARQGVLFENVISQAPWTTPSFGTIFTSLYPSQHGSTSIYNMVRPTVPTLATILRDAGYATGAVVNAPALSPEFGISRGFDHYDIAEVGSRDATGTTLAALDWIDQLADSSFLVFIHYFDVHLPYAPPAPYDTLFDPGYRGTVGSVFDADAYAADREELLARMRQWSADDRRHVRSLYDGELAFTDTAIGALLDGLGERGLRRKTLVILLSDHGEEFFEHGAFGHGHSLFREVLRVPLIFSLPGTLPEGVCLGTQVRLLDVTPTILDLLGVSPGVHFEGMSLLPLAGGQAGQAAPSGAILPPDVAFSEAVRLGPDQKSLTTPDLKVIHNVDSGSTLVFDLVRDRGETSNVADSQAGRAGDAVRTIYETLFGLTDSWYIEIATGQGTGTFDVDVACARGARPGTLRLVRRIDGQGDYSPVGGPAGRPEAPGVLALTGLTVSGTCKLAFKSEPPRFPLTFNIRMDGAAATAITYLGSALTRPEGMPFAQNPGKETCRSRGLPGSRPVPPYVLVYFSETPYDYDSATTLRDETTKQLRSLGYVQ